MSTRLSRRGSFVVGLSIVVMLLVSAPMLAFADGSPPTTPPGNSAAAPGQTDATPPGQATDAAPGNSENAPGHTATTTVASTTTTAAPGNSGDAPGHNKTDTTTATTTSTPPGNSANSNAGGSGGGNGNNVPASNLDDGVGGGVGNSENQDKTRPNVSNGPGTGQEPAPSCPNDKMGGDDTGHGANNGSVYDSTCNGRPSDNGQGGGNATGRPCMGCVGNADDKNPGNNNGQGQYPGPRNDRKNRGYECDDNNGVGKGNPAHTGCAPIINTNCTSWSASVVISGNGSIVSPSELTDGSHTYTSMPTSITVTANANGNHTPSSASVTLTGWSSTICSRSGTITFTPPGQDCRTWTLNASVSGGTITGPSDLVDGTQTYSSNPGSVTVTAAASANHSPSTRSATANGFSNTVCTQSVNLVFTPDSCVSNCGGSGCVINCSPPPPPDCDGDGINDNFDTDLSKCQPVPPKKDCDGDGVPDDVDSDMTGCEPIPLCPDGSVMPANGKCKPQVLPDFVLGIRVNRKPVTAAVQPAAVKNPAAALLPFTGGNLLPFVLVSVGLIGAGIPALRRRNQQD